MEKSNATIKIGEVNLQGLTPVEARLVLNYRALKLYQRLQRQGGTVIFGKGSITGNERQNENN